MPSRDSRSTTAKASSALLALGTGALLSGCPAALLIGGNDFFRFLQSSNITIKGDVFTNGFKGVKVGAMRFFEGTDATGSFFFPDVDFVDFGKDKVPLTAPVATSGDERGEFALKLDSNQRHAQWILVAWADVNKNGRMDWDETRAGEYYVISKMDSAFFGYRASGSVLIPFATGSPVIPFGDASKVRFKFVFPIIEEPPVATS